MCNLGFMLVSWNMFAVDIVLEADRCPQDISKREIPFFCISKYLSNKQKKNFMSYTL